jgi:hypothetical protein
MLRNERQKKDRKKWSVNDKISHKKTRAERYWKVYCLKERMKVRNRKYGKTDRRKTWRKVREKFKNIKTYMHKLISQMWLVILWTDTQFNFQIKETKKSEQTRLSYVYMCNINTAQA